MILTVLQLGMQAPPHHDFIDWASSIHIPTTMIIPNFLKKSKITSSLGTKVPDLISKVEFNTLKKIAINISLRN